MSNIALLFLLILTAARGAALHSATDICLKEIVPYEDRNKIKNPIFTLELSSADGGRLRYIGAARHSFDPNDPEFSEFEKAWNDFKPTVAYFEGDNDSVAASRDEAIRNDGEPGLIRFLAARDKVPAASLEPSRQDEVNYLLTKFPAEEIKLFYVLRIIAEDRVRQKRTEAELRSEVTGLLNYFSEFKGLEGAVRNADELESAYGRYWKTPEHWWEAPELWFNPLKSSSQTGGVFTNEVNKESSSYRDVHMYTVLAAAAREGNRVFAVVGRDHIPMQEAALRCALK